MALLHRNFCVQYGSIQSYITKKRLQTCIETLCRQDICGVNNRTAFRKKIIFFNQNSMNFEKFCQNFMLIALLVFL